jgi:outer membrane protein OmpA-like peptidoglycan-associated protein
LAHAYGESDASKEARNIFDQLRDGGVATSYLILFDFDSAKLRDSSKAILRSLSHYIANDPKLKLQVEGHTCTIGSYNYNMSLSQRRAESVKRYLIESCGISPERLKAVGFGFTKPEKPNTNEANRARNRRVIFRQF